MNEQEYFSTLSSKLEPLGLTSDQSDGDFSQKLAALATIADDNVISHTQTELINQMQWSETVHGVFFSNSVRPVTLPQNQPFIDETIVALICASIASSSLYGFAKTINKAAADALWQKNILDEKMIRENKLLYDQLFPKYCSDGVYSFDYYLANNPTLWAKALAKVISSPEYITLILPTLFTDVNWVNRLRLKLYKLNRLDPSVVGAVLQVWHTNYPDKAINEKLADLGYTSTRSFAEDEFLSAVNAAINKSTHISAQWLPGDRLCPAPILNTPGHTNYGEAVGYFVWTTAAHYGLYIINSSPANTVNDGGGGGCFTGDTPLMLPDGSQIAIKSVKYGDSILGYGGVSSLHSEEIVSQTLTQPRMIYGINDCAPFFTAGHAFLTEDGTWKAISPECANEENPNLNATQLEIGDLLLLADKSADGLLYKSIQIARITQAVLPAGEKIYGLHLIEGPHSYHVNRFVVRMNYPMLTEDRLTRGFAKLSKGERKLIRDTVSPIMPLLKKAVGDFVAEPLLRSLADRPSSGTATKQLNSPAIFGAPRGFGITRFNPQSSHYEKFSEVDQLHFNEGNLFLTSADPLERIENCSLKTNELSWLHKREGRFVSGRLRLSLGGRALIGQIFTGSEGSLAVCHQVMGCALTETYDSKVSKIGAPSADKVSAPADPVEWVDGIKVKLDVVADESGGINLTLSVLSQTQVWQPLPAGQFQEVLENDKYVIYFAATDYTDYLSEFGPLWPANGKLIFAFDASGFSGYLQPYDSKTQALSTEYFFWKGTLQPPVHAISADLRGKVQAARPNPILPIISERNLFSDSTELSLADLLTSRPGDADVRKLASAMLMENMKWAIGSMNNGWLSNFFGENQPVLTTERIREIKKDLAFYTGQFAIGYLSSALNSVSRDHGGPATPLSVEENVRLKAFIKTGLAKTQGYANQTTLLHRRAYVSASPNIQKYLSDGSTNWAEKLFTLFTSKQQLLVSVGALGSANPLAAMGEINGNATLLTIFDPSGTYTKRYYERLKGVHVLGFWVHSLSNDKEMIAVWISQFLNTLTSSSISSEMKGSVMGEYITEIEDIKSEAAKNSINLAAAVGKFIASTWSAAKSEGIFERIFGVDLQENITRFLTEHPTLDKIAGIAGKFATLVKVTAVAFGFIDVFQGLKSWSELTDAEKGQIILTSITLLGSLVEAVPSIIRGGSQALSFLEKQMIRHGFLPGEASLVEIELSVRDEAGNLARSIADATVPNSTAAERWAMKFEGDSKLPLKSFGLLTSAAFAAFAVYNFVEDLIGDKPVNEQAFDGIIASSAVLETVFVGLDIFAAECSCAAAFGPAAVVFAVIGFIFTLVELFEPQPKPESPVDKFFRETALPFIHSLPDSTNRLEEINNNTASRKPMASDRHGSLTLFRAQLTLAAITEKDSSENFNPGFLLKTNSPR